MLKELDTPEWEKAFKNKFARQVRITREDVERAFYLATPSPDHKFDPGFCEMLCSDGYLGVFQLKGGRVIMLKAWCDGTSDSELDFIIGPDLQRVITEMAPIDRRRLGLQTKEDEELSDYSDA